MSSNKLTLVCQRLMIWKMLARQKIILKKWNWDHRMTIVFILFEFFFRFTCYKILKLINKLEVLNSLCWTPWFMCKFKWGHSPTLQTRKNSCKKSLICCSCIVDSLVCLISLYVKCLFKTRWIKSHLRQSTISAKFYRLIDLALLIIFVT